MKHSIYKKPLQLVLSACVVLASTQAIAADEQPIANVIPVNTIFALQVKNGFSRGDTQTSITGPRGYSLNVKGSTNIDLSRFGKLDDGLYRYEITAPTGKTIKLRKNRLDNGRGNKERGTVTISETQTGIFRVKNGSIVTNAQIAEEKG